MVDLDKLLELESKATPEKWSLECYPTPNSEWCKFNFLSPHGYILTCYAGEVASHINDVLLMNSMRENFRQICLELKAAREVIAEVQANEDIYGDTRHCVEVALKKYNEVANEMS